MYGIGDIIRKKRKEKKLTQAQLAANAGLSTMSLHRYENGSRIPPIDTLSKIAAALDMQTDDFIGEKAAAELQAVQHYKQLVTDPVQLQRSGLSIDEAREKLRDHKDGFRFANDMHILNEMIDEISDALTRLNSSGEDFIMQAVRCALCNPEFLLPPADNRPLAKFDPAAAEIVRDIISESDS